MMKEIVLVTPATIQRSRDWMAWVDAISHRYSMSLPE
jgi:hypothetical protein